MLDAAISYGSLTVNFGAVGPDRERGYVIGRTIVEALETAGLTVEWTGSSDTAITIKPITWRKRLPTT